MIDHIDDIGLGTSDSVDRLLPVEYEDQSIGKNLSMATIDADLALDSPVSIGRRAIWAEIKEALPPECMNHRIGDRAFLILRQIVMSAITANTDDEVRKGGRVFCTDYSKILQVIRHLEGR